MQTTEWSQYIVATPQTTANSKIIKAMLDAIAKPMHVWLYVRGFQVKTSYFDPKKHKMEAAVVSLTFQADCCAQARRAARSR